MTDTMAMADPWTEAREQHGRLAPLIRVIDLEAGTDEFQPLAALKDLGELLLDGCTLIKTDRALEHDERREIIRRFDEARRLGRRRVADPEPPKA